LVATPPLFLSSATDARCFVQNTGSDASRTCKLQFCNLGDLFLKRTAASTKFRWHQRADTIWAVDFHEPSFNFQRMNSVHTSERRLLKILLSVHFKIYQAGEAHVIQVLSHNVWSGFPTLVVISWLFNFDIHISELIYFVINDHNYFLILHLEL
jgi:hypothetical protein